MSARHGGVLGEQVLDPISTQRLAPGTGKERRRGLSVAFSQPSPALAPENPQPDGRYSERGGTGRGTYWMLAPDVFRRLRETGTPERDLRIDWEAAKTRILSGLRQRAERGEEGLSNEEIRRIARLDRNQAGRLMRELRAEVPQIQLLGVKKGSRYAYRP